MSAENLEQTFNVGSQARLKLSNIRGTVEILPGEAGLLSVTAAKHAEFGPGWQNEDHHEPGSRWGGHRGNQTPGCLVGFLYLFTALQSGLSGAHPTPVRDRYLLRLQFNDDPKAGWEIQALHRQWGDQPGNPLTGEMKVSSVSGEGSGVKLSRTAELEHCFG